MPIDFTVSPDGHVILALATHPVTPDEFVDYEIAHAIHPDLDPPVAELLEIEHGALDRVTMHDMHRVLERRKVTPQPPTPHRCGVVVNIGDTHAWNLAKFYEGMSLLHSPQPVIVFGDPGTARTWLGIPTPRPAGRKTAKP